MPLKIFGAVRSLKNAFNGIIYTFRYELSFRIQSLAAIIALFLAFILPLKLYERTVICLLVCMVLVLELINSAIERVVDLFKPAIDHSAKFIKNIMAGAVFLAAIFSLIIGIIIFSPHFISVFTP